MQKRFMTRIALGLPFSTLHPRYQSFESRLEELDLTSLSCRRDHSSVIIILKILREELFTPTCLELINKCIASSSRYNIRRPEILILRDHFWRPRVPLALHSKWPMKLSPQGNYPQYRMPQLEKVNILQIVVYPCLLFYIIYYLYNLLFLWQTSYIYCDIVEYMLNKAL